MSWRRRVVVALSLFSAVLPLNSAAEAPKVFRYAFPIAETGFDPAQVTDLYSRTVTPHIFDGL